MVEAELAEAGQAIVGGCGRDHGRAGALRELDRGEPDTAGTGLDEDRLARVEVTELEEAVVGRPERDGHARGRDDIGAVGDRPRHNVGTATSSACEPESIVATTRWPT